MSTSSPVVWITGASSGIGEALVYAYVDEGARVILSARREKELERVKQACGTRAAQCTVLPLDLTDPASIQAALDQALKRFDRIDILINNGGVSQRSMVHETDAAIDRKIMEVNFFGPLILTKGVLPRMLSQGDGRIVAISSVVGKFGFPMRSAYSASKHAMHGFFETLGLECEDRGVSATLVCPGRVKTAISLNAVTRDGSAHGKMDPGQEQGIPADVCARKIVKAVKKRKHEVYIGRGEVAMVYFRRFIPPLFRMLAKKVSAT